jgi:hypothetical protein
MNTYLCSLCSLLNSFVMLVFSLVFFSREVGEQTSSFGGREMDYSKGDQVAKPDAKAVVQQQAMHVANGTFLPLVTDKVRNNVRSRAHLIAIYALIAAIVSVIVILTITPVESLKWTGVFAAPPSIQFAIGVPFEPFSFQVRNDANIGVEGLDVLALFMPIDEFDIEVALQSQAVISRTVSCVRAVVILGSTYTVEDEKLCVPNACIARTDETGMALFSSCAISFGPSVTYVVIAYVLERPELADFSFTVGELDVASANITRSTLGNTGELRIGSPFELTVAAEVYSAVPLTKLTAVVTTLNLGGENAVIWAPFSINDDLSRKTAYIENATSTTEIFTQKDSDASIYVCNFFFSGVALRGSSSSSLYLGVVVGGSFVIPISSKAWNAAGQQPQQLVYPFQIKPLGAVAVSVTPSGTLAGASPTAVEGTYIFAAVQTSPGKIAYVMAAPSALNPSTSVSALEHPQKNPKDVWFNVLVMDESGHAAFDNFTIFSTSGAVGYYDLFVIVDGIVGTWGPSGAKKLTVLVTSAMSSCRIDDPGDNEIVIVGSRWDTLPSVTITNSNGLAIPGKYAQLRSVDPASCGVIAYSTPSGDDGVSSFSAVVVGFARISSDDTRYFAVVVDGIVVGQVRRRVFWDFSVPDQCSFVNISSYPVAATASGTTAAVRLLALTAIGSPAESSFVTFFDDEQSAFVYENSQQTDESGLLWFNVSAASPGVSSKLLQVQCATEVPSFIASAAVIVFRARIDTPSAFFAPPLLTVDFSADWASVSADNPILVSAEIMWLPTYVAFYSYELIPSCQPALVTQQSQVPVSLTCSAGGTVPGWFVVLPVVDRITILPALEYAATGIIGSLTITQSAFDGSANGAPFKTQQPIILVKSKTGNLVQDAIVYILLISRPKTSSGPFEVQLLFDIPRTLRFGAIVKDDGNTVNLPNSALSDAQGLAAFSNISLIAAAADRHLSVRYCTSNDAAGYPDVCVDEAAYYLPPDEDQVDLRASVTEIVGTPGARLSNEIELTATSGAPPAPLRALLCTAFVTGVNSSTELESFLRFHNQAKSPLSFSDTNVLTMVLGIAPTARAGQYQLHLACSGALLSIPIGVTKQAVNVNIARLPPAKIRVDTTFSFVATVQSTGSLTGAYLEARFSRPNASCEYNGCGVLSDASTVVSKTNRRGEATFFMNFKSADDGPFDLFLTVRESLSPSSARSSLVQSVAEICGVFGLTRTALIGTLDQNSPVYENLKLLYDVIAGGSQGESEKTESKSKSSFLSFLGVSANPVTASLSLNVFNPVHSIEIVRQGNYDILLSAVSIRGLPAPLTTKSVSPSEAALVLLLDGAGVPVANASVEIVVLPIGAPSDLDIEYPYTLRSNASGYCLLHPLKFSTNMPGEYELLYSSNGGASVVAKPVRVTSKPPLTLSEAMKYASFIVLAFFSPMLLGTVPHSRPWYLALGLAANIVAMVAIFFAGINYGPDFFPKNSFVKGYFFFVYCLTCLILVLTVATAAGYFAGYTLNMRRFRFLNDEARALRIFKYAVWITNVRVAKQTPKPKPLPPLERLKAVFQKKKEKPANTFEEHDGLKDLMLPKATGPSKPPVAIYTPEDPVLQYDTAPDPSSVPMDYLIVLGISTILMVMMALFTVYIFQYIQGELSTLLAYFPVIQDSIAVANAGAAQVSGIAGTDINEVLSSLLGQVLQMVAQKFPKFSSLATASVSIQKIDLTSYIRTIETALREVSDRFTLSFWIAFTTALVIVVGSAVSTLLSIRNTSAAIRRQTLIIANPIADSQGYIGVHCIHFVVMQQIAFWLIFIVALLISISFIRIFIWEKAKVIIFAMLGMALAIKIFQKMFVKHFLTFGNFTIIRPEMYAIWDFFAIIVGIFEGIRVSISRVITAIAMVIVLFAKLDVALYPPILQKSDKAHSNFLAIINTETKNNNPLYLMMCVIMLLSRELRRLKACGLTKVSVETLFEGERSLSACVINLARIYGRFLCGAREDARLGLDQPATASDLLDLELIGDSRTRRWNKMKLKFRLLLLLHRHPQLRRHRKNFLYNGPQPVAVAGAVLIRQTESASPGRDIEMRAVPPRTTKEENGSPVRKEDLDFL